MKRIVSRLSWFDWAVVAGGLALVAWLGMDGPDRRSARQALVSEPVFELVTPEGVPNEGQALADFDAFRRSLAYYGAFATGAPGAYGWSDNFATQTLADERALAHCGGTEAGCRIVARLGPKVAVTVAEIPLSHTAAKALDDFENWPPAKAIAITAHGTWGAAWNENSRAAAKRVALKQCQEWRDPFLNGPHGWPCTVVREK